MHFHEWLGSEYPDRCEAALYLDDVLQLLQLLCLACESFDIL